VLSKQVNPETLSTKGLNSRNFSVTVIFKLLSAEKQSNRLDAVGEEGNQQTFAECREPICHIGFASGVGNCCRMKCASDVYSRRWRLQNKPPRSG
jgi:hypothetical protein